MIKSAQPNGHSEVSPGLSFNSRVRVYKVYDLRFWVFRVLCFRIFLKFKVLVFKILGFFRVFSFLGFKFLWLGFMV